MKTVLILVAFSFISIGFSQNATATVEVLEYQASENEKFSTVETTLLTPKDFENFDGLDFFPINLKFRVEASFVRTPAELPFLMPTTTSRLPEYVKYGEAHFEIDGNEYKLNLYQNTSPSKNPDYVDYLFLPFTDLTSGEESYGGGRFLDARIPKRATIILDFNKAYNPYCAYNSSYSCPIPPKENHILMAITAGVKAFADH
jgi:uncharacterized protein (DUF1684 family)